MIDVHFFLKLSIYADLARLGPFFLSAEQKAALRETAEKVATTGKGIAA